MIVITEDRTATIDATFLESWIIDTGVDVETAAVGIDASGAVSGRAFIIKGILRSTAGPAMELGDSALAASGTSLRVDYLGSLISGGAGLVALSGGVTVEVTGDLNGAGLVSTTGTALDFRQGGNTIKNDGSIVSTAGIAILSADTADDIVNNGAISAAANAIVSDGGEMTIENNGTLAAAQGHGILSSAAGLAVLNTGTITAGLDAIWATGPGTSITNFATISSMAGAGIAVAGIGAVIDNTTAIAGKTFGIVSTGAGARISNSGTVTSDGTGIHALGDGSVVNTSLQLVGGVALVLGGIDSIATNLNEIHGTSKTAAAVNLIDTADFTNNGAVFARSAVAVLAAGGDNSVENTGSLHGDVKLGGGNDWFGSLVGEVGGKVYGGQGDDIYEAGILLRIVERAGQGNDTVKAMFTWTLGDNIENLQLIGDATADASGNRLANILTGNAAGNRFWGDGGRDLFVMQTNGGDDTIMDFRDGKDLVDFRDVASVAGFADIDGHMHRSGRDVVIDLADEPAGMVLIIRKFDPDDLTARDFLF